MTSEVVTVGPDVGIAEVARLMLDRRISGLPVVDRGRLVGIVSEGDLMRRAELTTGGEPWWAAGSKSAEEKAKAYTKAHGMKVADVMTRDVVTIGENEPLDRIAMLFESRGIKRAPVVRDGKVVGIVSRANLLQGVASAGAGSAGPGDEAIRRAILATAQGEAGVRASLVDVTVADGVAHLWGNVVTEAERKALRICAEQTKGVREVKDHLRVIPPSVVSLEPE
jgi:CBS domain-containing protein